MVTFGIPTYRYKRGTLSMYALNMPQIFYHNNLFIVIVPSKKVL